MKHPSKLDKLLLRVAYTKLTTGSQLVIVHPFAVCMFTYGSCQNVDIYLSYN